MRDFDFWFIEAQKKRLDERTDRIQDARIAQAEGKDYQKIMNGFERSRLELEGDGTGLPIPKITSWLDMSGGKRIGRA